MDKDSTNHPLFKVGDTITLDDTAEVSTPFNRLITEVRDTGYTWEYPDVNGTFLSENSNDPFLENGWVLAEGSSERNLSQVQELNKTIQQLKEQGTLDTGELSDTYHTFNELYDHRMVLFSVITNQNKSISWKSHFHHDGTMYPEYFIVGINTEYGQFTYHYHAKYWSWFDVPVLDNAPEFDGHTSDDVTRLLKLRHSSPKEMEFDGMKRLQNKLTNGDITRNEFLRGVMNRLAKHSIGGG